MFLITPTGIRLEAKNASGHYHDLTITCRLHRKYPNRLYRSLKDKRGKWKVIFPGWYLRMTAQAAAVHLDGHNQAVVIRLITIQST